MAAASSTVVLAVKSDAHASRSVQKSRYPVDRTESSELTLLKAKVKTLEPSITGRGSPACSSPPPSYHSGKRRMMAGGGAGVRSSRLRVGRGKEIHD